MNYPERKNNLFTCWTNKPGQFGIGDLLKVNKTSEISRKRLKSRKLLILGKFSSKFKSGRWSEEEHGKFLKACYEYKEDWKKVKYNLTI